MITTLVSSAKDSHVKALRNQINELKDNKWDEPSAVKGWMFSQMGRNEAVHVSGIHHSEGVFYFLPKDLSFSFYPEISHVAFRLRVVYSQLCIFLETWFSTALNHLPMLYTTAEWKECRAWHEVSTLLWNSCPHRKVLLSREILLRKYFRFFSSLASSQEFGAHEYSGLLFILCSCTPLSASWDMSSLGGWKMDQKDDLKQNQAEDKNSSLFICQQITQFSVLRVFHELSGTQPVPIAMYMCSWPPEC